jgi:hypothetical protein
MSLSSRPIRKTVHVKHKPDPLFVIDFKSSLDTKKDKYASRLSPCNEINGEWSDDYIHLEYWQLGSYFIPARKAFFAKATYDKIDRKRYFDLNEYKFPAPVSDSITITKTHEFTGITEFHVRW